MWQLPVNEFDGGKLLQEHFLREEVHQCSWGQDYLLPDMDVKNVTGNFLEWLAHTWWLKMRMRLVRQELTVVAVGARCGMPDVGHSSVYW